MSEPDDDLTPLERIRRTAHRDIERVCDTWPHALQDALARGYGTGRTYDGVSAGGPRLVTCTSCGGVGCEDCAGDGYFGRRSEIPDPTGAAACKPDFATAWIAELADIIEQLAYQPAEVREWDNPEKARKFMHGQIERIHHSAGRQHLIPVADYNRITLRLHRLAEQAWYYWPDPPRQGQQVCGVTVGQRGNTVDNCELCNEPAPGGRDINTGKTLNVTDKDGRTLHRQCWYTLLVRLRPPKPRPDVTKDIERQH